jgi:exodeoxyribonuclease V
LRGYEETNLDGLYMQLRSTDMYDVDGLPIVVNSICSIHHFDSTIPEPHWRDVAGTDAYTFGYAATAHKFQGSQTERALVYDQSSTFEGQKWKHLYTNFTRAQESVDLFYT